MTEARWSTWKWYCDAAGMSLGRAIVALIDRELMSVIGESGDKEISVLTGRGKISSLLARRSLRMVSVVLRSPRSGSWGGASGCACGRAS